MSDTEENDLFNIQISDSEEDKTEKKSKRTGQSEDDFQAVKSTYRAKVENGNVRDASLIYCALILTNRIS